MSEPETTPAAPRPSEAPPPRAPAKGRAWALALVAGLVTGGIGFGVAEATLDAFPPDYAAARAEADATGQTPPEMPAVSTGGMPPANPADMKVDFRQALESGNRKQQRISEHRRATLAFGAFGGVLGLSLGLAGGLASGSARRAASAGLVGLVLGGAAGAGVSFVAIPPYQQQMLTLSEGQGAEVDFDQLVARRNGYEALLWPSLMHGVIWASLGAAAGLALGLGLDPRRKGAGLVGGLLGAVLATLLYGLGGPAVFVLAEPPSPIPELREARAAIFFGVAVLVALGAVWGALSLTLTRPPRPKPVPSPEA